jgi:hypothetical protein
MPSPTQVQLEFVWQRKNRRPFGDVALVDIRLTIHMIYNFRFKLGSGQSTHA